MTLYSLIAGKLLPYGVKKEYIDEAKALLQSILYTFYSILSTPLANGSFNGYSIEEYKVAHPFLTLLIPSQVVVTDVKGAINLMTKYESGVDEKKVRVLSPAEFKDAQDNFLAYLRRSKDVCEVIPRNTVTLADALVNVVIGEGDASSVHATETAAVKYRLIKDVDVSKLVRPSFFNTPEEDALIDVVESFFNEIRA